jgi:chromosome segregation protein
VHLKKIEMKGFKSFAQRAELHFDKGITAVVGPNGCGKSNIADAIRWVLGEQSARSLRGQKMEDIIFSGTDRKKPQGLAEVTIVFDNSSALLPLPYQEVAITRRVYRSGESEYYLNRTKCRLKDVRELLMDTGIGKEGLFHYRPGQD